MLDEEDALRGFRQLGGPLLDRRDVADVTQFRADDDGEWHLRQLGFHIEPFARDGKLLFEDRADARQFVGGIGQHMHERAWRFRLSDAAVAFDRAGYGSRILHGGPGLYRS